MTLPCLLARYPVPSGRGTARSHQSPFDGRMRTPVRPRLEHCYVFHPTRATLLLAVAAGGWPHAARPNTRCRGIDRSPVSPFRSLLQGAIDAYRRDLGAGLRRTMEIVPARAGDRISSLGFAWEGVRSRVGLPHRAFSREHHAVLLSAVTGYHRLFTTILSYVRE